jgi:hypothetical protein
MGPGGIEMMPTEFERHGGCGSFKKWKKSILVGAMHGRLLLVCV